MSDVVRSPIFGSVAHWLDRLPADKFADCEALNALLNPGILSGGDVPICFVAVDASFAEAYEPFIYRTGQVPTRSGNWHDLFNALAWLSFPRTKRVLNCRHVEEIRGPAYARGVRGTPRDVLTLFDEGGVIVTSSEPRLLEMLRTFQWKRLFWDGRTEVVPHMRFFVLGHAILEKASQPYKAATAKALLLEVPACFAGRPHEEQLAEADALAAQWLSTPGALSSTRNLAPLPILGIPGWAEGQSEEFYEDTEVFRSGYMRDGRG